MTPIISERVLASISFFFLFLVTLINWVRFVYSKSQVLNAFGRKSAIIAFVCITIFLVNRWFFSKHFPLSNLYESSMFLSWNLTLVHLVLINKSRNDWIGAIIAPGALLAHGFATLGLPEEMQEPVQLVPALKSHWLIMHVTTMILSYAMLLCGSLLAITLLVVAMTKQKELSLLLILSYSDLKNEKLLGNNNYSYESKKNLLHFINYRKWQMIEELDGWSYRIIGLGFPLLTIGILSGAVWANEAWGSYWNRDPKETWALITWLVFAIYLHSRMIRIWRKEQSAFIGFLGFLTIWICYLGVNLLGKGLHNYGWLL